MWGCVKRTLQHCRVGDAHLLQSLSVRESPLLLQILQHIVLLSFNSPVQTCFAVIVLVKPVLTKSWNEVLYHIKVAVISSKVQGIETILLMQDETLMIILHEHTHIRYTI